MQGTMCETQCARQNGRATICKSREQLFRMDTAKRTNEEVYEEVYKSLETGTRAKKPVNISKIKTPRAQKSTCSRNDQCMCDHVYTDIV